MSPHQGRCHRTGGDDERIGDEGFKQKRQDESDGQAFDGLSEDLRLRQNAW
jgi:hypothetical protein